MLARNGTVTFEWPKGCESWQRSDVKQFFDNRPEFMPVEFDGCAVGVQSTRGRPIKKSWRLMTTSKAIVELFSQFQCSHKPHEHDHAVGSQTARTAFYPRQMTVEIARALYPNMTHPCHPCHAMYSMSTLGISGTGVETCFCPFRYRRNGNCGRNRRDSRSNDRMPNGHKRIDA